MSELIVLTSASGKQCARLIPRLVNNPKYKLRLVASRQSSVDRLLKEYPATEVVQADLNNPNDVSRVLVGAHIVLHIGPSFHPHETQIGYHMVDACLRLTTLRHFIFSSVLHTQLRKLLNHDSKRYVEEYLIESKLPWTIVQPTRFHDTLPVPLFVKQYRSGQQPVFNATWNPDTIMSHIALDDLADAYVKIIEERKKHFFAEYPLCSGLPVSTRSMVEEVGRQLGTSITINRLTRESAEDDLMTRLYGGTNNAPLESREQAARLLLHYDTRGLQGNPNVLEWLLEKKPTSNTEWVAMQIAKERSTA